jgi:hypothetical protein
MAKKTARENRREMRGRERDAEEEQVGGEGR